MRDAVKVGHRAVHRVHVHSNRTQVIYRAHLQEQWTRVVAMLGEMVKWLDPHLYINCMHGRQTVSHHPYPFGRADLSTLNLHSANPIRFETSG